MKLLDGPTLAAALGIKVDQAEPWVPHFRMAQGIANLNTPQRMGSFLAQVNAETNGLIILVERMNAKDPERLCLVYPKHFPTVESARPYLRSPAKLANKVYATSNGNRGEASGDGWNYRGRGGGQVTGLDNYRAMGRLMGLDLVAKPELLENPAYAIASFAWFWKDRNLNRWADLESTEEVTYRVNGSRHSAPERHKFYERTLTALC